MSEDGKVKVFNDAPAPDPLIGRVINDKFKINALIARGGMGKVYRAEQAPLGRSCAVKVLSPTYEGNKDPEFHRRFFLEASVASKLSHPNTVTIFDYGRTDDDIFYMAMEYLEGRTLHQAIRQAGRFSEARTIHVARQICRALREAHSLGVVHRDLKPANIFLLDHGDENDFVKVLDFGLVKNMVEATGEDLTQTGLFLGSPKYMAPEQIRGERVDARTDIYALGVLLFEAVTGRVPFDSPNTVKVLTAHLNDPAPRVRQAFPNSDVSEGFEALVAKCLAKSPDHRFGSMDEVLAALREGGGSVVTRSIESTPSLSAPPASSSMAALMPHAVSGESTVGMPHVSPPIPTRRSRRGAVGALLGAIAAAAIVGYASFRPAAPLPAPSVLSPAPTEAMVTTPWVPVDVAAPARAEPTPTARVRVNSWPDGALVKEDGVEVCGGTPCEILYKGGEADPSREHKLTISRPGYRSESRIVRPGGEVDARLAKMPDAQRPVPQAQPRAESPAPVPTGYRPDLPY